MEGEGRGGHGGGEASPRPRDASKGGWGSGDGEGGGSGGGSGGVGWNRRGKRGWKGDTGASASPRQENAADNVASTPNRHHQHNQHHYKNRHRHQAHLATDEATRELYRQFRSRTVVQSEGPRRVATLAADTEATVVPTAVAMTAAEIVVVSVEVAVATVAVVVAGGVVAVAAVVVAAAAVVVVVPVERPGGGDGRRHCSHHFLLRAGLRVSKWYHETSDGVAVIGRPPPHHMASAPPTSTVPIMPGVQGVPAAPGLPGVVTHRTHRHCLIHDGAIHGNWPMGGDARLHS